MFLLKKSMVVAGMGLLAATLFNTASARPVNVTFSDSACDGPGVNGSFHELGTSAAFKSFSQDESITSSSTDTDKNTCAVQPTVQAGVFGFDDEEVTIKNTSKASWENLWFVADEAFFGTGIFDITEKNLFTNWDSRASEPEAATGLAMRIDNTGSNTPLVSESETADLVFEPDEEWTFFVQNWTGSTPITFGSEGIGGASDPLSTSNASIIAQLVVPDVSVGPENMSAITSIAGLLLLGTFFNSVRQRKLRNEI